MTLRLFWRRFHLWIGVACGLFLLTMTLSGTALLFGPKLDRWLQPSLYAVTGPSAAQPADVYLAKAKAAVPNAEPAQLRWPEEEGFPLTVLMRMTDGAGRQGMPRGGPASQGAASQESASEQSGSEHHGERKGQARNAAGPGGRPRVTLVYLDPPTGDVLGTGDPRASIVGLVRTLHTDLLMPAFNGRAIVGWMGAGLFILCLTGIYLWWPRGGTFLRGLRWRRGPVVSTNLHHRVGFWIVLPLTVMAFTGIFQAFQQQGRAVIGLFVPTTQQAMRQQGGSLPKTNLDPQQALEAALASGQSLRPMVLALPTEANKAWRLQASTPDGAVRTLLVDDATKAVSVPQPLQGDAFLAFMRRIHEGSHDGPVWNAIVFFTGLSPPLLFVTGIIMWLRRRRNELRAAANQAGERITSVPTPPVGQDHIAA